MMHTVTHLTSKDNPLLKNIRLLATGSHRAPEDLVIAEGARVLEELNRSECAIEGVVFSENFGRDSHEENLIDRWHKRGIRLYSVKEKLFESLSCLQMPQGAMALVHVPEAHLPLKSLPDALILYACGLQDPGNMGTLIRTAAAAGATLVCTSKGTVSARNPKSIRSSAGVFFQHTPVEHVDTAVFLRYCRDQAIRTYRTDTRQGVPYTESDLKCPCAILLGNEGNGIKEEEFEDLPAIHIPMANGIDSLNVALAGAILLFEASRQRSRHLK